VIEFSYLSIHKALIVPFIRKRDLRGLWEPTLSQHQLWLTIEVKYLGLTLDKGLTRKAWQINVTNKACRAFWTCKDTFGKTWGLKPRVLRWICTMVIRPVLAFVSMVWWLRFRFDVSSMELIRYRY
jgi:hypothetical protein